MQLFGETHIDFMKYRKFWISVSLILILVALVAVAVLHDLNFGIDFKGGTQITLKLRDRPDVERLRTVLAQGGIEDPGIQRFGTESQNEIIVRTGVLKGSQEGSRDRVVAVLDRELNRDRGAKPDLNGIGRDRLTALLVAADPEHRGAGAPAYYVGIAESILQQRRTDSIFKSWDEIGRAPGVTPAVLSALQQRGYLGHFSVEGVDNVGPQIGKELRRQGLLAVLASLLGMLAYIWFRFELRFGIGAIMACVHDVIVTLGLFTLAGYEFNLTTVAAFLTLVGYSMNDTVVIFDRVRENMRKNRREPLIELLNRSINETLSRTILTGGLTFLTVIALWYFGNETIRGFAFVMGVGILVGTYSSCYVASPFVLLWEGLFGAEGRWRRDKGVPAKAGATSPYKTPASAKSTGPGKPSPAVEDVPGAEAPATARRPRPRPANRRRSR